MDRQLDILCEGDLTPDKTNQLFAATVETLRDVK
jgi:hypothetical protein